MIKVCSKCNIEKEIDLFPKVGRKCKQCLSEYRRQHYMNNKEHTKKVLRKYYDNNREKILKYSSDYYKENKEHIDKQHKEYRDNNEDFCKEIGKIWYIKNKKRKYFSKIRRILGITEEVYEIMKESQNNKCSICRRELPLCVDHCHITNKVRGLLCRQCNCGIGNFEDNIEFLKFAIEYLEENNND